MKNLRKGILIAFEGIDGAGKTTQALQLRAFLLHNGYDAIYLKEPTNSYYGQKIRFLAINGRHHHPDLEHDLFLKDRLEDVTKNIAPALENKKIVIMDRYYFSNMCYQGALGLNVESIQKDNEIFSPKPDLVILLDISPRVGISRITTLRGEKTNHFEQEDYLNQVKKIFEKLDEPYIQRIPAVGPIEEVEELVQNAAMSILRRYVLNEGRIIRKTVSRIQRASK